MITIDYKDRKPIYEQLVENIKALIVRGVFKGDDQLPSVRQLANELAINPNTIQKAYAELERQGVTYTVKGRGSFVASNVGDLKLTKKRELFMELENIVKEIIDLEITLEELNQEIGRIYRVHKGGEQHD